jgi:hypothetical protein
MDLTTIAVLAVGVGIGVSTIRGYRLKSRRENYIRTYMFPTGVFEKFAQARPGLGIKEQQLVARALRQFFLAYLKSGFRRVAMPSRVVDDLWHEFILYTKNYAAFCDYAFGRFLHHTPAVKMGPVMSDNEGLRRVWWFCCLEENINPRNATRLPLLFALDRKLGIADGFVYDLQCRRQLAKTAGADGGGCSAGCADSFSDPHIDGTIEGFGDSASGDGGGGCSGGCGGGGD